MNLIYDINDKPKAKANIVFALQQLLAIIAATILVPTLVNGLSGTQMMSQAAALFGAGAGTLVYVAFTKRKSPVFLGSSFAFINPLVGATAFGYFGILLGAIIAGLVYTVIAIIIRFVGTKWVDKLLPAVIIGPTVALIGLSLCGSAISNVTTSANGYNLIAILCGLITFGVTALASAKGSKGLKLIPFIIGVLAGYVVAAIFTIIGTAANVPYLVLIDFTPLTSLFTDFSFASIFSVPDFMFVKLIGEGTANMNWATVAQIFLLFAPVTFVILAEHVADHKNLSSIIGRDLIKEPGLNRTLLGDGVGTIVGSVFGGCPNTTYGESVGCVAITRNASVYTIILTAIFAMVLSFFTPFVAFVNTIPSCVVGGICIALYGFIAVSGLKMIQKVDLEDNANLFTVSVILITGIGGMAMAIGKVTLTATACALILGILVNILLHRKEWSKKDDSSEE